MNSFNATGRIVRSPELRYTTNSVAVCNFTLAVQRNFKNANGEYEADFLNCVAYRGTGEAVGKYTQKGDKLGISGRVQTRSYENSKGDKVYVTEIIVENIDFLEAKKKEENIQQQAPQQDPFATYDNNSFINDEDLPF